MVASVSGLLPVTVTPERRVDPPGADVGSEDVVDCALVIAVWCFDRAQHTRERRAKPLAIEGEQIAAVLAVDRRYTAADYVVPPADCDRDSVCGARGSNRQGGSKQ